MRTSSIGIRGIAGGALVAVALLVGAWSPERTSSSPAPGTQPAVPATLANFWVGTAKWQYQRVANPYWPADGSSISIGPWDVAHGAYGWYLTKRTTGDGTCYGHWGTEVWVSWNKGSNWTQVGTIVTPTARTPWACLAGDGSLYWNQADLSWHYLFECVDASTPVKWNGCSVSKYGPDPGGPPESWVPVGQAGGLVINSGQLWSQICGEWKACDATDVGGEGTFDIFRFDGTDYYVDFHGYSPTGHVFYRGVAKTPNFVYWYVAGLHGTPTDRIFGPDVQAAPGNVDVNDSFAGHYAGGGSGSIIVEGNYWYFLQGDVNDYACPFSDRPPPAPRICDPPWSTRWDLAMGRSSNPSESNYDWRISGRNPIMLSTITWNNLLPVDRSTQAYPRAFKDPLDGSTYLYIVQTGSGLDAQKVGVLYKLVHTGNVLNEGDFNHGQTSKNAWSLWRSTMNYGVWREPWMASDHQGYMTVNCNGTCQPADAVYQDVATPSLAGTTVAFSGKLSASAPVTGTLTVIEFNAANFTTWHNLSVSPSTSWQSFGSSFVARTDTTWMRFVLYINDSWQNYYLDEMYLGPPGPGD